MGEAINELTEGIINLFNDTEIEFDIDNRLFYMASMFYYKQRHHLISLLKLGNTYDSQIICRCMIEGYALLQLAKDNHNFADEWYNTMAIENLELQETKDRLGLHVSVSQRAENEKLAKEHKHKLKPSQIKDIKQTNRSIKSTDFKFDKNSMKNLIKKLSNNSSQWEDMYSVYNRFSKWQHWNISGFSEFSDFDDSQISFENNCSTNIITTLYGVFCFIEVSIIFNELLKLGKEKELEAYLLDIIDLFNTQHLA